MRRASLLLALAASLPLLSGCGLRPLYAGGEGSPVVQSLRSVSIAPIAGQSGWIMRNKLISRLGEAGSGSARYRLDVTLDDNIKSFGLRSDRAATQERRSLRARYQLVETSGSDAGIDIVGSEYATVAAEQTVLDQLSEQVADQIVARLALYAARTSKAR